MESDENFFEEENGNNEDEADGDEDTSKQRFKVTNLLQKLD